jgi:hypothetical protein
VTCVHKTEKKNSTEILFLWLYKVNHPMLTIINYLYSRSVKPQRPYNPNVLIVSKKGFKLTGKVLLSATYNRSFRSALFLF